MMAYDYPHSVSRTYQYKKVTKPLLERKRRARINRCLDELKDLMVDALEAEGEDMNKLEKADILELTVRHLQRLHASRVSEGTAKIEENRWLSGFGHCAAEACKFLSALPGEAAERLARHLTAGLQTSQQSDQSVKPDVFSPTLASLGWTDSLVPPASVSPTIEISRILPAAPPNPEINPKGASDSFLNGSNKPQCSGPTQGQKEDKENVNICSREEQQSETKREKPCQEDDEEIDVERVDEGSMWRPW